MQNNNTVCILIIIYTITIRSSIKIPTYSYKLSSDVVLKLLPSSISPLHLNLDRNTTIHTMGTEWVLLEHARSRKKVNTLAMLGDIGAILDNLYHRRAHQDDAE